MSTRDPEVTATTATGAAPAGTGGTAVNKIKYIDVHVATPFRLGPPTSWSRKIVVKLLSNSGD